MTKEIDVIVMNSHGVGQFCNIKRLPYLGETLRAWNWRVEEDGGKGTTVAVSLGRLGVKTAYIGKVGKDPWGDLGFKWMGDAGVDTTYMYQTDEVATGTGLVMIDEEGRNTIVDGDSSLEKLTVDEIRAALDDMKDAKFFLTGFAMPQHLALTGAKMAHEMGITTVLNPSPLPHEPMGDLSYIDYIVLNEVEGRVLAEAPEDSTDYEKIARRVREIYHCGSIVMTLGEEGCLILHEDKVYRVPSVKVDVVETVGAGDSYLAAFVTNLVWGKSVEEAAAWAVKCSALKVYPRRNYSAFPFLREVEEFIASWKQASNLSRAYVSFKTRDRFIEPVPCYRAMFIWAGLQQKRRRVSFSFPGSPDEPIDPTRGRLRVRVEGIKGFKLSRPEMPCPIIHVHIQVGLEAEPPEDSNNGPLTHNIQSGKGSRWDSAERVNPPLHVL